MTVATEPIGPDEFGPLAIRPHGGAGWAPAGHPDRLPANYHKLHGVRQFHGCYSVGEDTCECRAAASPAARRLMETRYLSARIGGWFVRLFRITRPPGIAIVATF